MLEIYSAEACPFAQRTRALLTHLDEPFEAHEIDLSDRDPAFLELTPTGKVPLLIDGDFKLYESQVINEYLADSRGWHQALPEDSRLRARVRLAMKQWDDTVLGAFYESLADPDALTPRRDEVEGELDELRATIDHLDGGPGLLAFHCAPHWARMDWLRAYAPLVDLIEARTDLHAWLQEISRLPAIRETLPDREETVRMYEERFVGQPA